MLSHPTLPAMYGKLPMHTLPHIATRFYLRDSGAFGARKIRRHKCLPELCLCPGNPVPTLGGAMMGSPGPVDQRVRGADRYPAVFVELWPSRWKHLYKVRAELCVSADVPDTMFVVKLLDIYPDGYEAIVRKGYDRSAPQGAGPARAAVTWPDIQTGD